MESNSINFKEKFESKVFYGSPCGCHYWTDCLDKDGYGRLTINYVTKKAHRLSYQLYKGKIRKDQLVCHSCDNPACVNPDHLFLGTPKDNMIDMVKKKRQARGILNGLSKLDDEKVTQIRELIDLGTPQNKIAKLFNVGTTAVSSITHRKTWKHV